MTANENSSIRTLGDRGLTVDGSANDVRGREVTDKDGHGIGTVAELFVDDEHTEVRFLLVEHGGILGFGATKTLIPVDAITKVTEDDVVIDQSTDRVASTPAYAPRLVSERAYHASIYDHYGYTPTWGEGYLYPYDGTSR